MNRWYTIKAADVRGAADISIYEEIGGFGVTAKQFAEDLKALGDVSHINLRIHSPGGDVFEGIAIYNLLRNHPADITVYIDGVAASMASVVAMAGDRVVMPENAMMMIHKPWGTGSLSNFHEAKRVGLNGFSKLDKVPEGAEYKYITTSDKGVPIALATYGNIFSVTRQAIINDDLTQLTTIPMAMGRAAARTVGNLVYLLLTSNGKFTDGKALFHADHKNLIAKDMDMVGLDEARKLMRLQEDANGDSLNITPAFVLVPAALESAARRAILSSSSVFPVGDEGTINQNPGIINVVKDMAEVIVEPRLDKANSKEWYVAAAKGMDTIEVAYLDGMDTPYLEEQVGFTVDGVAWKVRIDAGVAALDYRGLLKSNGA